MNRFDHLAWRRAVMRSQLDHDARHLAHVLSSHVGGSGDCYPNVNTLVDEMGRSKNTVKKAIRRLEAAGFVAVSRSRGKRSHRYQLLFPDGCQPVTAGDRLQQVTAGDRLEPAVRVIAGDRLNGAQQVKSEHLTGQNGAPNGSKRALQQVTAGDPKGVEREEKAVEGVNSHPDFSSQEKPDPVQVPDVVARRLPPPPEPERDPQALERLRELKATLGWAKAGAEDAP